jgi:hypothetical protein
MLKFEKIGGTSMSRFGELIDNVILAAGIGDPYGRIFEVSAYADETNWLLSTRRPPGGIYSSSQRAGITAPAWTASWAGSRPSTRASPA